MVIVKCFASQYLSVSLFYLSLCLSPSSPFLSQSLLCLSVFSLFLLSLCTGGYVSTNYYASYVTSYRAYTNFTCPEDDNTVFNCTYDVVDSCDGNEAIIVCLYG